VCSVELCGWEPCRGSSTAEWPQDTLGVGGSGSATWTAPELLSRRSCTDLALLLAMLSALCPSLRCSSSAWLLARVTIVSRSVCLRALTALVQCRHEEATLPTAAAA